MEQSDFKYLAIRNWDKFQATKDGGPALWIKDYTNKDGDYDYGKLTCFQRYVFDGCRRLRGRFGHNLHNDATWIARALNVMPTERARVVDTIATLVERGLLLLTNERDHFSKTPLVEKSRGEKRREAPHASPSEGEQEEQEQNHIITHPGNRLEHRQCGGNVVVLPDGGHLCEGCGLRRRVGSDVFEN
jgi:hypothetical protein